MKIINIHEAKTKLSALLAEVAAKGKKRWHKEIDVSSARGGYT